MSGPLELELDGAVAVVRLCRPEVRNAVDGAMMDALERALEAIEAAGARAVIVTGAGEKTFCAGGDLDYFAGLDQPGDGVAMSRRMQTILRRLAGGPRPVIAALAGDAVGGGCEIALACHLRIAAAEIRFAFRPAALGISTGWGGGLRLFRLVGRSAALRLLLLAETVDADEALRLGLVDRVVPAARVMDEAVAWAKRIASSPPASIRAILELARAVARGPDDAAVAVETRLFGELWEGEDFRRVLEEWRRRSRRLLP